MSKFIKIVVKEVKKAVTKVEERVNARNEERRRKEEAERIMQEVLSGFVDHLVNNDPEFLMKVCVNSVVGSVEDK